MKDLLNIVNEAKVDVKDISAVQIPSKDILQKIVDTSNPSAPKKDKGGKGFWAFADLLKKESALLEIGKKPLKPMYVVFMYSDGKHQKNTKFYGLAGCSTNYFTKENKAINQELKPEVIKKCKGFFHILIWQTDPQYAKAGLAKTYLESLEKAAKELHSKAITIKCDDEKTIEIYKQLGFKESEILKGYLIYPLAKTEK